MKKYLFTICLLMLLLICAAVHPTIQDLQFINREYNLKNKYIPQLIQFSQKHDIRIETLHNWIMTESSGREKAVNRKSHDYGLCQLHNVKYLVSKYWQQPSNTRQFNVWDGKHNLQVALAYLGDLISELGTYNGFMAYNIGRSRVIRGEILDCGRKYVSRILPGENLTNDLPTLTAEYVAVVMQFKEQILFDDRRQRV